MELRAATPSLPHPLVRPEYCQYVSEACDQHLVAAPKPRAFFAYPSEPAPVAGTIAKAVTSLRASRPAAEWLSWQDLDIQGQIIYCTICRSMRGASVLVADVSTLNFNVMFEIGYAIGLGLPVYLLRDTTIKLDKRAFADIGILDTLGYLDFANSSDIINGISRALETEPLPDVPVREFRSQPIYLMKAPIPVEGSVALQSTMKKARLGYRAFDPVETPRLSIQEARRQVAGSAGVIADLLDPERERAETHNARCALVCGMAMAQQKAVLMLQEELTPRQQPLDYRDVVKPYRTASNVAGLMRGFLTDVVARMQKTSDDLSTQGASILSELDLGDVAAENEIEGLKHYFVTTGPSIQARQGHARLVIGRKGAGKTAIFYQVRSAVSRGRETLVIDLKPEGHQFIKLRESVLARLGAGFREHTMVAFWHYLLLAEIARYALDRDRSTARLNPLQSSRYDTLQDAYGPQDPGQDLDFSQRLTSQVDRVTRRLGAFDAAEMGGKLTEVLYSGDYRVLEEAVREYLRDRDEVWLLIDNLDKGWPIRSATADDILIVRSLLEATRRLQRELLKEKVEFHCLVFLRSDIYESLRAETPDKGKDTAIRLDWDDPRAFEQVILRRLEQTTGSGDGFESSWRKVFPALVNGEDSFNYIVERTLMRPRDLLKFVRYCVDTALNRGHQRVEEDDVLHAERSYSSDLLTETVFEIADTHPELSDVLWVFERSPRTMGWEEACDRIGTFLELDAASAEEAVRFLLWFGFFGVVGSGTAEARYAYQLNGDTRRLLFSLESGDAALSIHPAFHAALDVDF